MEELRYALWGLSIFTAFYAYLMRLCKRAEAYIEANR